MFRQFVLSRSSPHALRAAFDLFGNGICSGYLVTYSRDDEEWYKLHAAGGLSQNCDYSKRIDNRKNIEVRSE